MPFLHPDWTSFMLSVPRRHRREQFLYKQILQNAYPDLFSLRTKTCAGLPLNAPRWERTLRNTTRRVNALARRLAPGRFLGISPLVNYIDFDEGFRKRDDLMTLVHESIQRLRKCGVADWINLESIWNRHQRRQGNYADALTLLASLEINLAAL